MSELFTQSTSYIVLSESIKSDRIIQFFLASWSASFVYMASRRYCETTIDLKDSLIVDQRCPRHSNATLYRAHKYNTANTANTAMALHSTRDDSSQAQ